MEYEIFHDKVIRTFFSSELLNVLKKPHDSKLDGKKVIIVRDELIERNIPENEVWRLVFALGEKHFATEYFKYRPIVEREFPFGPFGLSDLTKCVLVKPVIVKTNEYEDDFNADPWWFSSGTLRNICFETDLVFKEQERSMPVRVIENRLKKIGNPLSELWFCAFEIVKKVFCCEYKRWRPETPEHPFGAFDANAYALIPQNIISSTERSYLPISIDDFQVSQEEKTKK